MNIVTVQDESGAKTQRLLMIQKVLEKCLSRLRIKNVIVDVTLVSDQTIKKLNGKYRKKNKPTDVLSFSQKEMFVGKRKILGDIVIAKETTQKQAKKEKHLLKDEYTLLAVHGLLHLLGYDHERMKDELKMFTLQKELIDYAQAK